MRSIFLNAFRRQAAEPSVRGHYIIGGRQMRSIFLNAFRRQAAEPSVRGHYIIGGRLPHFLR